MAPRRANHLLELLHPQSPLQQLLAHVRAHAHQMTPMERIAHALGGGGHHAPGFGHPGAEHPSGPPVHLPEHVIHGFGPGGAVTSPPVRQTNPIGPPAPTPAPLPDAGGYRPAEYQRAVGNDAQAYEDWVARHPAAMAGRAPIPPWVLAYQTQMLKSRFAPPAPAPAPAPMPPTFQAS